MNLEYVDHRVKEVGWKPARNLGFASERFNLQYLRLIRFKTHFLLVFSLPVLDIFTLSKLQGKLEWVFLLSKGAQRERNLLLYIVAGKVTQQALHALKMDQMNLLRFSKKGTGTRKIHVVDEASKQVYGPYPAMQPYEKELPYDLRHVFLQALSPDGAAYPSPIAHDDVASLIDRLLPISTLQLIGDSDRADLAAARVEAFSELDRRKEAEDTLDALLPRLEGDELGRMQRFKARYLMAKGQVDESIWMLDQAAGNARNPQIRAAVVSTKATAYAIKHCFKLAEDAIREALQIAPDQPRAAFALAHLYLQTDRRLEARDVLERMRGDSEQWVNSYIDLELANIALLLGEFDEAHRLAASALDYSPEIINPLSTLGYLAMLRNDLPEMERLIGLIEARSPQAEMLTPIRLDLERLRKRNAVPSATHDAPAAKAADDSGEAPVESAKPRQNRLESFPSLVQRRDHCGPSTIELVLRYWQGGLELTNTDIASHVMLPGSGTPIYRMTEFFRLVGFDTMRCIAPTETLKQLVDAGFPTIVDLTSGGIGHVTVVIGYDEEADTIELQDPMTHQVLPLPVDELNQLRQSLYNSAIVAFPAGKGHNATLAKLGLFPDEVLALLDKAVLAMEVGNHAIVFELLEQASRMRPQHGVVWAYWLETLGSEWQDALDHLTILPTPSDPTARDPIAAKLQSARSQFYAVLERARRALPDTDFIYFYSGRAAQLDGDLPAAIKALQKTHELSPTNADTMAVMAECQFDLQQVEQALESAREAIKLNPGSPPGNVWMARCLAYLHREHAEYYARIGLEIAPAWAMAHLAMAEAYLSPRPQTYFQPETRQFTVINPPQAAWQELDAVLSRTPSQPEALVLRAHLLMSTQDYPAAQAVLDKALQVARTPMAVHRVYQAQCMLLSALGKLDEALSQAATLLEKDPGDSWALQFQADLAFRQLLLQPPSAAVEGSSGVDIEPLQNLYLKAIQANKGAPEVVQPFLNHLRQMGKGEEAVEQARSLSEKYPEQPNLVYMHAATLRNAGQKGAATSRMLEAMAMAGALTGRDALCYAIDTIVDDLGPEKGEQAVMGVKLPPTVTSRDRDAALGIILSFHPTEKGARARQLLESTLADDPNDAEAIFWLSNVAVDDSEREALLKKAVFLAPQWTYARMILSGFMIDHERYDDALDFITGHEYESVDMLTRNVFCLNQVGSFEQAAPAVERLIQDPSFAGERPSHYYWWKFTADLNCGEYAKVLETARQAQERFPDEADWYYPSTIGYAMTGKLDEASAALALGEEKGMDPDLVNEGKYWIAMDQDKRGAALVIAQNAQQAAWNELPKQKEPNILGLRKWSHRYLQLMIDQGMAKEAEKYVEFLFKDSRVWETTPVALSILRDNSLTEKCAERVLKSANITRSARYNAMYARAIAYRNQDDTRVREAFEQLRTQFPLDSQPVAELAVYAALDGDLPNARRLADQAVVQGRSFWQGWAARGLVRMLSGQREAALSDLKSAWFRTGDTYYTGFPFWWLYFSLMGDIPNAKKYRDKAIAQAESTFDQQLIDVVKSLVTQRSS